ncbi:MAG: biotin--[acetyl-CoA-carboxylase] ligase [Sphingobacteriia bacterium]|nr:biotin--[acetyl-CoA-carboxylase] ligase [Sphingobacteriia bacterium]
MKYTNWQDEFTVLIYDQIDSTNTEAQRIGRRGLRNNFLLWGKIQTEGHGKYGRAWLSNPGNLTFSLLINKPYLIDHASQLVFVTGVALAKTLEALSHKHFSLKWPNDVILNDKKCAGILLESGISAGSDNVDYLVIGIGLNINNHPDLPERKLPATSLTAENIKLEDDVILDHFMNNFLKTFSEWEKNGFTNIRKSWLDHAYGLNNYTEVSLNKDTILKGYFTGIDERGLFIITDENNVQTKVSSGEVFFKQLLG